jgi:drug/metabolite transporter (DMT)-like permease
MIAAALCFSVMNSLLRVVAGELDPLQMAFLRNLFSILFMMPWLWRNGLHALATARPSLHLWRAGFGLVAMYLWFFAIAYLPLAEAVALNFTVPLFATVGAALFLGETVRARRWSATAIGFFGVLVILRPGFEEVTMVTTLPILAALFMAISSLLVKKLASFDSPAAIVTIMTLILTPLSLVPALFVWRWPSGEALMMMIAVGGLATLAHLSFTRAYSLADASAVVPFDYMRLPFVALIAYVAFGELPDFWTWVGAGIIAASAIYITHREARRNRAELGAAANAPRARL